MNTRRSVLTVEFGLYAAIVLLAAGLRLLELGAHPLNDVEARAALAPLARLRGGPAGLAGDPALAADSPAYFFFTFLSFFLFGANDATARLAPALAGTLLVLAPALLRDQLGRGGALAAAALLAVSSSLVAASRSADGAMIALTGFAFGLAALYRALAGADEARAGWLALAGAALGVGVAAGGAFGLGLLAAALTALVVRWTQPEVAAAARATRHAPADERANGDPAPRRPAWAVVFWAALGLAVLVVTTTFMLHPRGLGELAGGWAGWLGGFRPGAPGRPPQYVVLFLLTAEPLLMALGIAGAVRAFRRGHPAGQALAWFALVALVVVLARSGRGLIDTIWVAAPLAVLGGWLLYEAAAGLWEAREWPLAGAQLGVTVALSGFALLNVAQLAEAHQPGRAAIATLQVSLFGRVLSLPSLAPLGVALLALALVVVVAYLVALGWSERAAKLGLMAGAVVVLLSANVSAGWGVTRLRPGNPAELWWEAPANPDVHRLMRTLGDVSNYTVGNTRDIEVTVLAPRAGLLGWALRDFPNAVFVDRLSPEMAQPVVITPIDQQSPTLGDSYVGQDFDLRSTWTPQPGVEGWLNWLAYRRAPTVDEMVILWVRQDVQQLQSTGN